MRKAEVNRRVALGRFSLASLVMAVAAVDGPALAADVTANDGDTTSAALQEVIVTAQRRSENLQRAAVAVDVVSTDEMALAGASRASDLPGLVPALQIGESGQGQQSLYLRGVGTFSANSYSDPAVAFNVDGVAIGRPSSMTGVMYDLARVEVLKGPQGTLYGRNATGGAINIVPNLPRLGVTSADLALTVGTYGEVHPEGSANIALSESSAARLAFTYTRHDGYQSDGSGDADTYAGRVQYLVEASDTLSVRVAADYDHDGGHNAAGTLAGLLNPFTGVVSPSPFSRNVGFKDPLVGTAFQQIYSFINGRFLGPIIGTPKTDAGFWGVTSEINWNSPIGTMTILPSHRESNLNDFSTALGFGEDTLEHDKQTSLEVRLASPNEGLIRWLLGGYYYDEGIDATYQFNQQAGSPIQDFSTGTTSRAAFSRVTFAPTDEFRMSAGVRYTHDDKTLDGVSQVLLNICTVSSPIPACPATPLMPPASSFADLTSQLQLVPIIPNSLYASPLPGAAASVFKQFNIPVDQNLSSSRITWHGGLEYDLTEKSFLYANVDTGYHAGGFAFATIKPTYNPEYLTAYSIGSKNRFVDDRLQLNLEGFYWLYKNQQIPHGVTDTQGEPSFITDNVGSSTIKGVEVSLLYRVLENTTLSVDTQYMRAVYDSFTYTSPAGGTNGLPVTGCPFSLTDPTHYTVNCQGKTLQQSPDWSGNVSIQQVFPLGNYEVTGEVSTRFQSASMDGFEQLAVERQGAYAQSSISIMFAPGDRKWTLTAFVNNLQNERPYGQVYFGPIMGVFGASVGPPRTAGVRATAKF